MKRKKRKKAKIVAIVIASLLIVLVGGFYIYTLDYYRADNYVAQTLANDTSNIQKLGSMTVFYPDKELDTKTGFIF